MIDQTDLRGVIAACITPVTEDYRIDVARLGAHAASMLDGGCSFVSLFGTTGEGASFSSEEKLAALSELRDAGHDMGRHVAGVIASSIDEAAKMVAGVAALGCRAALVLPPFYYAPASVEAVADFYRAVIERAGSPELDIVLYNIPAFSGVRLTPDHVAAIQGVLGGRGAGLKDSTGELDNTLAIVRGFPDLSVFTGDDRILPDVIAEGGAGLIGGTPNLFPETALKLASPSPEAADRALAARRIEAIDGNGGLTVIKSVLAHMKGDDAYVRVVPPLAATQADTLASLLGALTASPEEVPVE
ncbi:dihydrodipicolinate synthase family protein [Roseicyclus sp. F158]|uniref:Dihydrodipicolinate synthase family protein n=1 Tax=Tropicimonas omnivorans TaxID=3075590 RepID=A0ABU3DL07_9RHOB|nr:dihydrodipicolinate synthase family protein [Roseicyclus sp. F158]MDT0684224.1 dihydrodipicolinate synthase family protein [Roseicyclus sp. F158]